MKFNEYLEQTTYKTWFNEYSNFYNYVLNRFYNYELLYNVSYVDRYINSLINNNQLELTKIEALCKNTEILSNPEKWKEELKNNSTTNSIGDNVSDTGYRGYNASGDYQYIKANIKNNAINEGTSSRVKVLDEFLKINSIPLYNIFTGIINELINIFQLIYIPEN